MTFSTRRSVLTQSVGWLFVVACASAPAAGTPAGKTAGDVITRAELADPSLSGTTVADAVRRLRPRFLNQRQTGLRAESEGALVSINGSQPGSLSDLARIEIGDVEEIRYLNAADANLRFGLASAMRPVLLVTLRTR
ncbi:MAG: hypothetical protein HOQ16_15515 [Gemmatimonadaceae bacterium]|nr:hypothetical protein [Gemmatimonadaceae bacterium]